MGKKGTFKTYGFQLLCTAVFSLVLGLFILSHGNKELFLWFNRNLTPSFGNYARYFSLLGESAAMGILVFLSLFHAFRKTLVVGLVWLTGACYSWVFKLWLLKGLPRPFEYFSTNSEAINLVDGVKVHHFNSFPSGHTLTAFSAAFLCLFLFPGIKKPGQLVLVLLALTCGLSRIVLAQHWPSDVLGGMVLGTAAAFTVFPAENAFPSNSFLNRSLIQTLKSLV
jgi:membrane-associated phospholipid phosphatase